MRVSAVLHGLSSFCLRKPETAWRVQSCDTGVIIIRGPGLGEREFALLPRAADESVN